MPELSRGDILARLNQAANGSHQEMARLVRSILDGETNVAAGTPGAAITNITTTATGTEIATAVNGILANMRTFGVIAT